MFTLKFFCHALLGVLPSQLWGHPDFEAFKRGFDIGLKFGDPSANKFLSVSPLLAFGSAEWLIFNVAALPAKQSARARGGSVGPTSS